jgi:hypothetical protein
VAFRVHASQVVLIQLADKAIHLPRRSRREDQGIGLGDLIRCAFRLAKLGVSADGESVQAMGLPDESRKTSNKGSAIEKVFKPSSYFLKIQRAVARQLANGSLATRPIGRHQRQPPSSIEHAGCPGRQAVCHSDCRRRITRAIAKATNRLGDDRLDSSPTSVSALRTHARSQQIQI